MMKNTYEAMYALSGKANSFYGMYNDEIPVLRSDRYWWGHMKVNQLAVSRPLIQDFYIDPKVAADYESLVALFNHKRVTETVQAVADFGSVQGGLTMKHFSKALEYGKDLYASLVAPALGLGLSVETWQHGGKEPSVCNLTTPMSLFPTISDDVHQRESLRLTHSGRFSKDEQIDEQTFNEITSLL
ncbi:deoxyribonuclease II [Clonorchis sinensis]|uniref:Deoxyribonuclease II n=1 Tax=Clonorchis sinensis TaxID=79923 RepID=G7YLV6_CLOSI|nr:deoxyribonuclease II [Clonorchis sinensis]